MSLISKKFSVVFLCYLFLLFLSYFFLVGETNLVFADFTQKDVKSKDVQSAKDLANLSFEQLINLKVTSVSKKDQKISESSAAIFVITQEDIRRSGVTSIPEALRMAPGIDVARINSNTWAITSRGFNGAFANKLLVLMDGRSVYTPVFSGVFWDSQDTLMEDIDRIEVIRGPGATLWGSNAVNGVINIITKNSKDTQGGLVSAGAGSDERDFVGARYGGRVSEETTYKVYAKYFNRDNYETTTHQEAGDVWHDGRFGMKVNSDQEEDNFTLQGDYSTGKRGTEFTIPKFEAPYQQSLEGQKGETNTGNLLGRWTRKISDTSDFQLQAYYDYVYRDAVVLNHTVNTGDIDFQHRFELFHGNEVIWGAGYRRYWDQLSDSQVFDVGDTSKGFDLVTGFVQDEISIVDKELRLILGSKFENTEFTGFELQPNARMIYQINESNSLWTAVSRAVRTPSRLEQDSLLLSRVIPGEGGLPPTSIVGVSTKDPQSENLLAYEVGYRSEVSKEVYFDVALFYNHYDDLLSTEPGMPFLSPLPAPHVEVPYPTRYSNKADAYGAELVAEYKPVKGIRLIGTYTNININYDLPNNSRDPVASLIEGQSPENQFMLRSLIDLPYDLEFDSMLRYTDHLPSLGIDNYFNLDLRLGWRPCKSWEFSVVGQNLIDTEHIEYVGQDFVNFVPVEVQRGVYGKVVYRW